MKNFIAFIVASIFGIILLWVAYSARDEGSPFQSNLFIAYCIVWIIMVVVLVFTLKPFSKEK